MKAIIVHGGAGYEAPPPQFKDGIRKALEAGYKVLQEGGSSTDAVEKAINVMEDDPQFDAGYGSFLNLFGEVEMDASIMKSDYSCGAVASLKNIQYPISVARKVMEETEHVFIVGEGANLIAEALGFPYFDPISPEARRKWEEMKEKFIKGEEKLAYGKLREFYLKKLGEGLGTVGAVAIDDTGLITAGTSTGGIHLKLPGRVGDTPIIGAGTYATPWAGASSTGRGECIIKLTLAKRVVDLIEKHIPQEAVEKVRSFVEEMRCPCGLIALDREGNFGIFHTTPYIRVGYIREGGEIFITNKYEG